VHAIPTSTKAARLRAAGVRRLARPGAHGAHVRAGGAARLNHARS